MSAVLWWVTGFFAGVVASLLSFIFIYCLKFKANQTSDTDEAQERIQVVSDEKKLQPTRVSKRSPQTSWNANAAKPTKRRKSLQDSVDPRDLREDLRKLAAQCESDSDADQKQRLTESEIEADHKSFVPDLSDEEAQAPIAKMLLHTPSPKLPQDSHTLEENDDTSVELENLKSNLSTCVQKLQDLQSQVRGTKAKNEFQNVVELLEDCEDLVEEIHKNALTHGGKLKEFLMKVRDDEEIEEDEREVAKWITAQFLNPTGDPGADNLEAWNPKPRAEQGEDMDDLPVKPRFQRFDTDRLRSVSSLSSLQIDRTSSREDSKTLETDDTQNEWTKLKFYRTQSKVLRSLEKLGTWEFDIFEIEDFAGDLMLPLLGVSVCKKLRNHSLLNFVDIPEKLLFDYLLALTRNYHPRSEASYHNALHAADVMCSSYALLHSARFDQFEFIHLISLILAAAAHDVDHDGFNNTFHINSGSALALKYNDRSVLENHHCAVGWKLMTHSKHNVLKAVPRDSRNVFRNIFISSILATDMTGHGVQLENLQQLPKVSEFDTSTRVKLLGHVLHSADISNVGKPFDYCHTWVKMVMQEFFKQGDKEKDMNLPVSPLCDRQITDIDSSEVGFIKFVVKPWYESLNAVLPDVCGPCLKYINLNYRNFKDRAINAHDSSRSSSKVARRSVLLSGAEELEDLIIEFERIHCDTAEEEAV